MKPVPIIVLIIVIMALVLIVASRHAVTRPPFPDPRQMEPDPATNAAAPVRELTTQETVLAPRRVSPQANQGVVRPPLKEEPLAATNKLERLTQIREAFRAYASGDPTTALREAKQLADGTQRETALLTLLTEWTQGELSSPLQRARAISLYGLEAGLGMELAQNPPLALLWANELTDGAGKAALLQQTAITMVGADPLAAFALSDQLPANDRRAFSDAVFAGWGANDTTAALQWADQLSDPAERDAAIQAIRAVAPVGIGAELRMQDGYPVINQLISGMPAELSGQLHAGDRIVGLAQGDNSFVDARNLSLAEVVQLIRGAPGTPLQLQILPAGASPDSTPQSVSIIRDQVRFKK